MTRMPRVVGNIETIGPQTMGPWDHRTMGPRDHGPRTMGPWDHRTMGPPDYRTTETPPTVFFPSLPLFASVQILGCGALRLGLRSTKTICSPAWQNGIIRPCGKHSRTFLTRQLFRRPAGPSTSPGTDGLRITRGMISC